MKKLLALTVLTLCLSPVKILYIALRLKKLQEKNPEMFNGAKALEAILKCMEDPSYWYDTIE